MFPEKRTGSCGMMLRPERRDCRPTEPMSTPSITIELGFGDSTRRNSDTISEHFYAALSQPLRLTKLLSLGQTRLP